MPEVSLRRNIDRPLSPYVPQARGYRDLEIPRRAERLLIDEGEEGLIRRGPNDRDVNGPFTCPPFFLIITTLAGLKIRIMPFHGTSVRIIFI